MRQHVLGRNLSTRTDRSGKLIKLKGHGYPSRNCAQSNRQNGLTPGYIWQMLIGQVVALLALLLAHLRLQLCLQFGR